MNTATCYSFYCRNFFLRWNVNIPSRKLKKNYEHRRVIRHRILEIYAKPISLAKARRLESAVDKQSSAIEESAGILRRIVSSVSATSYKVEWYFSQNDF